MKKYRRFKRWIFTTKTTVPLKTTQKDKDQVDQYGTGSTPASQQQAAIKMLETPITSRSLSSPSLLCVRVAVQTPSLSRTPFDACGCWTLPAQVCEST
jgi:hypothetical protein